MKEEVQTNKLLSHTLSQYSITSCLKGKKQHRTKRARREKHYCTARGHTNQKHRRITPCTSNNRPGMNRGCISKRSIPRPTTGSGPKGAAGPNTSSRGRDRAPGRKNLSMFAACAGNPTSRPLSEIAGSSKGINYSKLERSVTNFSYFHFFLERSESEVENHVPQLGGRSWQTKEHW